MVGMGLVKNKKVWCHLCSPQVINWRIDCTWFGNHPGSLPDRLFMLTFAAAVIDACGKEQVEGGSGDEIWEIIGFLLCYVNFTLLAPSRRSYKPKTIHYRVARRKKCKNWDSTLNYSQGGIII